MQVIDCRVAPMPSLCRSRLWTKAPGTCSLGEADVAGAFSERTGSEAVRGSKLAMAGRRLRATDVGLLAAASISQVHVVRQPGVRCLLTGRNTPLAGGRDQPNSLHNRLVEKEADCMRSL